MPLLKIFDDKDGNGGCQMKSDDLRTMTTIGQRTIRVAKTKALNSFAVTLCFRICRLLLFPFGGSIYHLDNVTVRIVT